MAESLDIEEEIDRLFQGPAGEFVRARNALAKRVAQAGDAAAAARVKAMTKPSVSAWAVNHLWWHARAAFDGLLDAGAQVRKAQTTGAGPAAQTRAGAARRKAVAQLLRLAEPILAEGGHGSSAATMRRITTSLEAAAAWGAALPDPGPGRLSADLDPPGFDALGTLDPSAWPSPAEGDPSQTPDSEPARGTEPAATNTDRAESTRAALVAAATTAAAEARAATTGLDAALRTLDGARARAQAAATQHKAAETAARKAAAAAREAEAAFHQASRSETDAATEAEAATERAKAAERALTLAREALADGDPT